VVSLAVVAAAFLGAGYGISSLHFARTSERVSVVAPPSVGPATGSEGANEAHAEPAIGTPGLAQPVRRLEPLGSSTFGDLVLRKYGFAGLASFVNCSGVEVPASSGLTVEASNRAAVATHSSYFPSTVGPMALADPQAWEFGQAENEPAVVVEARAGAGIASVVAYLPGGIMVRVVPDSEGWVVAGADLAPGEAVPAEGVKLEAYDSSGRLVGSFSATSSPFVPYLPYLPTCPCRESPAGTSTQPASSTTVPQICACPLAVPGGSSGGGSAVRTVPERICVGPVVGKVGSGGASPGGQTGSTGSGATG